jgi:hypothetical protein
MIATKYRFGGEGDDDFKSVVAVSDGFMAVGYSGEDSFFGSGNGNWAGGGKGGDDAIIVKFSDKENRVVWGGVFGGKDNDKYEDLTAVADGFVAVGYSGKDSFNDGDWAGIAGKGKDDAIIVKYDNVGEVKWYRNFGGFGDDVFNSVTTVSDGVVAVGVSDALSFNNSDWTGISGKGIFDAIIVKYDNAGEIKWKHNFGGNEVNYFYSVTTLPDGIVAVGRSSAKSFNNGDWDGITGKGGDDAIIIKYNFDGAVVWRKNFGGSGNDVFNSVTTVSDGIIAAGYSAADSFNNGDWDDIGKGGNDAIIVKYNFNGDVVWKRNFGGKGDDVFKSVTTLSDGFVAVGYSAADSFTNGDWGSVSGKGGNDAIIVKYDNNGYYKWRNNFGGNDNDTYNSVTAAADGIVAVGNSAFSSFDNNNWNGVSGFGGTDAIVVKHTAPVLNIANVPTQTATNIPLLLTGTVDPDYATFKTIEWKIKNAGTTNATITPADEDGKWYITATATGTVTVTATIVCGATLIENYTQDFNINVTEVGIVAPPSPPEGRDVRVYPNPTRGELIIVAGQARNDGDMGYGICDIEIFDIMGRKVQSSEFNPESSSGSRSETRNFKPETLNISHLQNGIYFVRIITENGVVMRKVVKN